MKDVKFVAEGIFAGKINTTKIEKSKDDYIVVTDFIINNAITDDRGVIKEQPLKITTFNKNSALIDAINVGDRVLINGYIRGKFNQSKNEFWTNLVMRTIRIL